MPNMMRYQRLSPEYIPLPSGRKPTPLRTTTCKEETNTNNSNHYYHHDIGSTKLPNFSFESTKPSQRVRSVAPNPPTTTTTSPDRHHFPPFSLSEPPTTITSTPSIKKSLDHHETDGTTPIGSDTLPQWGHNKRSRGSRSLGEDSSLGIRRHPAKIQRRSITVMDKQSTTVIMAPPLYSRGNNLRSCSVSKDRDSAGMLLHRNIEERSTNRISRVEKRHHLQSEKKMIQKPSSTPNYNHHPFSPPKEFSNPPPTSSSTPSSEKEVVVDAEKKLNMDLFEWPRIHLSLSRKEKEDDFLAMKGTKLPHRPKKRAKNIDKALQYCFPGMWLSELTRGRYDVREKKCAKKKRRGLKGLENMDSDSD